MKRFELADQNTKIPPSHKCNKCDFILYEAYECKENRCTIFCKDHLPENKKCPECDGEFLFDQKKTDFIKNKYQVNCLNCSSKMMLKDFDSHLKEECKKECTQKCGQLFSTEEEMEKHIKEECFQTVTKCIGCSYSSKRGEVNIHQEICEELEKIKLIGLPLENKIEQLEKEIFLLIERNKKQEEQINKLNQKNLEQDNKIFLLENQNQKQIEEFEKQIGEIKKQGEVIKELQEGFFFLRNYVGEQKKQEYKKKEEKNKKQEEEKRILFEEQERKSKEEIEKKRKEEEEQKRLLIKG